MYAWVNGEQCLWDREQDVRDWDCRDLEKKYRRASVIYESVFALRTSGGFSWSEQDYNEFLFSARAVRWSLSLLTYKKRHEYGQEGCPALYSTVRQLINEGKTVLHTFEKLWRGRNKESELRNVTMTFEKMFEKITAIDKRKLGPSS
jgi:hypothetical protein